MGADRRCDAIVGSNTCNLFNTNESGLCSMHEKMVGGTTLRSLLARVESARKVLHHEAKVVSNHCNAFHAVERSLKLLDGTR
jgi:hypothetical protein